MSRDTRDWRLDRRSDGDILHLGMAVYALMRRANNSNRATAIDHRSASLALATMVYWLSTLVVGGEFDSLGLLVSTAAAGLVSLESASRLSGAKPRPSEANDMAGAVRAVARVNVTAPKR